MTHHDPQTAFDPQVYREAMGPGYGVALFKEQDELTGHSLTLKRSLAPLNPRRRWLLSLLNRLLTTISHQVDRRRRFTEQQLTEFDDPTAIPECC